MLMPADIVRTLTAAARCVLLAFALFAAACAQLPTAELAEPQPVAAVTVITPDEPAAEQVPAPPAPPPVAATPAPPTDLWERIRAGFALPAMDGKLVSNWENYYSARPDYVAGMVERGSHYLFHIVEEVERRKMPMEIALLPMIESAYNPQAYSRAHASGLWQFIPSTGKLYGLRQNWWYDGRRDVIAATGAALDYLEKLYAQFGDWELALASYNWGEGAVARAMARNQARGKPTDYSSLTMPAETRNYLPKLIAVKNIVADPARFGLQLAAVPNEPYFAVVTVHKHIDVELAAKFAGMPLDEFKFLNPAHNKAVIKAGEAETIVLPRDRVETFNTSLASYEEPLVTWQAHTLKRGEKPEKVAARYGISMSELKQVNGISGRNTFRAGQPLLVPVAAGAEPNLPDLPATPVTLTRAYKAARAKNAKRAAVKSRKAAVKPAAKKTKPAQRAKKPATKADATKSAPATVVAAQDR
ncbi:MAG: transglycosylase SLT domain-containing protein [Burkholderiales bacterium]